MNQKQTAGNYSVEFDGENTATGIYFYTLEHDGISETKRMALIR